MTATEIRNTNFEKLRASLAERMQDVYRAFTDHGPCTTAELAERAGISILTLRPRTTDLLQLGLLGIAGEKIEHGKKCGVYAVTDRVTWLKWRETNFPGDGQLQMGLHQGALTS